MIRDHDFVSEEGEIGGVHDEIDGLDGKFDDFRLEVVIGAHENRQFVLDIVIGDHDVVKVVHKS